MVCGDGIAGRVYPRERTVCGGVRCLRTLFPKLLMSSLITKESLKKTNLARPNWVNKISIHYVRIDLDSLIRILVSNSRKRSEIGSEVKRSRIVFENLSEMQKNFWMVDGEISVKLEGIFLDFTKTCTIIYFHPSRERQARKLAEELRAHRPWWIAIINRTNLWIYAMLATIYAGMILGTYLFPTRPDNVALVQWKYYSLTNFCVLTLFLFLGGTYLSASAGPKISLFERKANIRDAIRDLLIGIASSILSFIAIYFFG